MPSRPAPQARGEPAAPCPEFAARLIFKPVRRLPAGGLGVGSLALFPATHRAPKPHAGPNAPSVSPFYNRSVATPTHPSGRNRPPGGVFQRPIPGTADRRWGGGGMDVVHSSPRRRCSWGGGGCGGVPSLLTLRGIKGLSGRLARAAATAAWGRPGSPLCARARVL